MGLAEVTARSCARAATRALLPIIVVAVSCGSDGVERRERPQDSGVMETVDAGRSTELDGPASDRALANIDEGQVEDVGAVDTTAADGQADLPATICDQLASYNHADADASQAIQDCIDRTAVGAVLALPPGRYTIGHPIVVSRPIALRTRGKLDTDPPCDVENADDDCFELVAAPAIESLGKAQSGLLWISPEANGTSIDHLVVNGNNQARRGSAAAAGCAGLVENYYGYNVTVAADDIRLSGSVSRNALCGTGMEIDGKYRLVITDNVFAYNGVHGLSGLWADGLTVTDAADATIARNTFLDNTDVDFIVGGCVDCTIHDNRVVHGDSYEGSSFAAVMLTVWGADATPSSSGDFRGADIAYNTVDCGAQKRCGFGLNIGTDAWRPDGPLFGGDVHDNAIRNAQQGFNVSHTTDVMHIYDNVVADCGGSFLTTCGRMALGSYNISPDSVVDLTGDSVPASAYTHETWGTGCVPNP